ncbi:MAG: hypothetical protein ACTHOR_12995 [Devosia sp.]
MKRKRPEKRTRSSSAPVNLAAKALGTKLFGQRILTARKAYSRKVKHRQAPDADQSVLPVVWRRGHPETDSD